MAGSSQPWYMPATWPVGHISAAVTKDAEDKPDRPKATPYLDLTGNLTAMAAAARSWTLAYLCIYYLPGKFGMEYPAFGAGKEFAWGWMSHILIRLNTTKTWATVQPLISWRSWFAPLDNINL